MNAIATLTMNPALDVATSTPDVRPTHKLRCTPPRHDPGGGGINVARVIAALGGEACAVFPSGGPAGTTLERLLTEAGVPIRPIAIDGAVRESLTVDEESSGLQYRFVLPGPQISAAEQARILDALAGMAGPPRFLVASGSLPPGVPDTFYRDVAGRLHGSGTRLILDTSGAALKGAAGAGAYLAKPSLRELEDRLGRTLDDPADEAAGARTLIDDGTAEVVVVSLGERGALLVAEGVERRFAAPVVEVVSAVGAGDSMVGAIALALAAGEQLVDAVRFGIAAGSAALLTPGTALVRRADVERLAAEVG